MSWRALLCSAEGAMKKFLGSWVLGGHSGFLAPPRLASLTPAR